MKNNTPPTLTLFDFMQNVTYFMITGFLFLFSVLPMLLWLFFTSSNLLDVIAMGLMFPSLAALVSCGVKYKESEEKIKFRILKHLFEGYKKNFKDTIKYCFIFAGILYVVLMGARSMEELSTWTMISLGLLASFCLLIVTYMILVATKFQFNLKGLFKVGLYCLLMNFKISVKILFVYVALLFFYPILGVFPLLILASPASYLMICFATPVFKEVYDLFVKKPDEPEKKIEDLLV